MKIAIFHDYFNKRGGGERLIINLAKITGADIYTGFIEYGRTFEDAKKVKITALGKKPLINGLKTIALMERFGKIKLEGYDFYIFSGTNCVSAAKNHHPNMLYLHTPPRYLYDLKEWYIKNSSLPGRLGLFLLRKYIQPKDQRCMRHFDAIYANSENVRSRVMKYYGSDVYKKTGVIYTGIETKKYVCRKSDGFYLSASRLDRLKRIDLIIKAFSSMPGRKLIIAGTGPEESRLKKLASRYRNIEFLGAVSDEKMLRFYSKCIATVSANIDEDLGLVPIEGQASGKPALAVREGGFAETIIEGKTGVFFNPDSESLVSAVKKLEKMKWNGKAIQKHAKKYDISVFANKIMKIASKS